jgi:hypothetical protein
MRAVPARWTCIYRRYGKSSATAPGHRNRARGRVSGEGVILKNTSCF